MICVVRNLFFRFYSIIFNKGITIYVLIKRNLICQTSNSTKNKIQIFMIPTSLNRIETATFAKNKTV